MDDKYCLYGDYGYEYFTCDSIYGEYALKEKISWKSLLFTLIVCAMALLRQVILIPLIREMSA